MHNCSIWVGWHHKIELRTMRILRHGGDEPMSHISRRDFLMGTAAVITAGMTLEGESSSAKAKTPQGPPIKCGIIGTGVQGRKLIRELTRMPGVEIVAVCDIYERNLQRGAKSIGKEVHTYTDYKQMLDREKDMQAVIIATPPALHVPMSIDALQAGKHVFCEAPLALDIEECKRMVRTVRQSDRIFQVGHQRRYNRLYKHALKFVKTGAISRVVQVRAQWHRKDSWRRVVSNRAHKKLLNWRLYKATSGGLLAEYGSHQLD
ncbi:MAG TPA: Gfo/Idh/MocA family oxidoreductase, partial [Armatimonadetes bacterium]|nr:Gfo/Idh/MocA family oxidoreductase [Armatimonadota bacterium]